LTVRATHFRGLLAAAWSWLDVTARVRLARLRKYCKKPQKTRDENRSSR
jgi:hypothetical protein